MGERVQVTLTVLSSQANKAESLFTFEADSKEEYNDLTSYIFFEVNYGTLPFLHQLKQAGIAYNSNWEGGSEWQESTESLRFESDGDPDEMTVEINGENPPLNSLMEFIDNHIALRAFILTHKRHNCPLPWDNQEEYGKLYLVKKLISS